MCRILLLVLAITIVAIGNISALPSNAAEEYLETHNKARSVVGVSPLKWSLALAKSASLMTRYQRDRKNCSFANLTTNKYGGNQLLADGLVITPRRVVEYWVADWVFYNYANNTCYSGFSCGAYTQVVWNKSQELGCAQARCVKDQASLTICFYYPPGNIKGERPY
ncbi:hypothetical protein ACH5RR_011364 [Cinchona calisaya]|uniref:SCP domain-containing protein n=1 Tax=Cinchona calisaya TaxID=153742 RepID=A0ABD3A589_9GENT